VGSGHDVNGRLRRRARSALPWLALALVATLVEAQGLPGGDAEPAEPPGPRIASASSDEQDRAIERRLGEIFAELEGAEQVRVRVRSGVVILAGEVLSQRARQQAVELARQVDGVVEVQDDTAIVRDIRRQIAPALDRLEDLAADGVAYLPLLAVAILVVVLFSILAWLLGKWEGPFRRVTSNEFLADFLRQLAKTAVVGVGLLIAFELLQATALVGAVLGAAGLIGLALGFALRDTVENYIAGVLLSMKQPFVHDDLVSIEGHEGHVLRLTSRATIIMTLDGNHVRIPNAKVLNGILVNYTRNPERRFEFEVGVSVGTNLSAAQALAADTLVRMEGVVDDPPPRVDVQSLGDSTVTLRVFGWVDQRRFAFLKVRSEAIRLVKEAFDTAGIVMPEPTYGVRMLEAAEPPRERTAGPRQAVDIERRTEIEREMANDRRETADQTDLLRPNAPLE
jgi:small-conductance mechanosensitive channel